MKNTLLTFIVAAMAMLVAAQSRGGVKVSSGQEQDTEKVVVFRVELRKFVTADPPNRLTFTGDRPGSKQKFTLIITNGTEIADGDEARIRYTPNSGGKPDPSKSSYWIETKEEVRRGKEGGDVFKIKQVKTKYAIQAPSGKFVARTLWGYGFGLSDKQDDALLVDIMDPAVAKAALQQPAPETPAPEAPAPPAPEKSATQ